MDMSLKKDQITRIGGIMPITHSFDNLKWYHSGGDTVFYIAINTPERGAKDCSEQRG